MASTSKVKSSTSELDKAWRNDSIYTFYEPPDRHHNSEVIFFHDIQQSENDELHLQTWMSSSEPSVCWPKDWLSAKFPEARISSARHHGAILMTNTTGLMNLYPIVENLVHDILKVYTKACPVFLVGHGLGGLVIKRLVQEMDQRRSLWHRGTSASNYAFDSRLQRSTWFLENIKGLFFYNTPHLGVKLADYTKYFPRESPLVENLRTLNAENARCNEWFREWRKDRCRTEALFALLPTKVALWYIHVVEEASARLDLDRFYTVSRSDHLDICKPLHQEDNRYHNLVQFIENARLSRESGLDPYIEDSSEIESTEVLLKKIISGLKKVPKGEGVCLVVRDLEKIRRFPDTRNRLTECFHKSRLVRLSVSVHLELWKRLRDHEPYPHPKLCD